MVGGGDATAWASHPAPKPWGGGCQWGPPLSSSDLCSSHPLLPSLGLVLPPYSTFYLQANLSDQILQVKCKWPGPCLRPAPPPLPRTLAGPRQHSQPLAARRPLLPNLPAPPRRPQAGAPAIGKSVELCMLAFSQIWFQTILSWFPLRFCFWFLLRVFPP